MSHLHFHTETESVGTGRLTTVPVTPLATSYQAVGRESSQEHDAQWFLIDWQEALMLGNECQLLRETLVDVASGFKRYFDFSGYYNSYVSGQLSKKEFEAIARKFSVRDNGDDDSLGKGIGCMLRECRIALYPNEIAAMFSVPEEQAERVLSRLASAGQVTIHDRPSLPRSGR